MDIGFNFSNGKVIRKWNEMREQVLNSFDMHHGTASIASIDEKYKEDAYNSIAIEGYVISRQMISWAITDDWSSDCHNKEELVIRGYYQAFHKVRDSIIQIKENHLKPGEVVEADFMDWYIEMWQPFVAAGILKHSDIIGYRNRPVYIKNSRHVPPASHKVLDYMAALEKASITGDITEFSKLIADC